MGPKTRKIVGTASVNPEWSLAQIAAHCGSTYGSVKAILCRARRDKMIGARPGDGHSGWRRSTWLPAERRADYWLLRGKVGAAEARRVIEDEMARASIKLGAISSI